MTKIIDVIIVGAGPVGLFAAFQAGMLGLSTVIIDSLEMVGGQCSHLYPEKPIYDIPAYPQILAQSLVDKLLEQIQPFKQQILLGEEVLALEDQKDSIKITTNKRILLSRAVVLATGGGRLLPNKPALANLESFENKSIFYKITNKELFVNKKVAIAGGGDAAIDWAIILAEIAQKVFIIHRRDKFRAMNASMNQIQSLVAQNRLELVTPYQLIGLAGQNGQLEAIKVQNMAGDIKLISCDFLLPFFGIAFDHEFLYKIPVNKSIDNRKVLIKNETMETSHDRIFAIGDIADYAGKLNLILTGFAEGALAMHSVFQKIFPDQPRHFEHSTTKGIPIQ
jgi:thioredoxin reductase (NADPH)